MPDYLEPAKSEAVQRSECLSLLKRLQNADGGWGFHAGATSRVEPSCWAALSLFHTEKPERNDSFRKLIEYLHSEQLPDGSWPASPQMKTGGWVTSLACSALGGYAESASHVKAGLQWICDDFPRDSSLWMRFLKRLRGDSRINPQNVTYRGWGWTPKTSSWVEPTSFALMTLRDADSTQSPKNSAQRREAAISLLYDRMCPGGGWNCGNPRVYGVDGDALVLPTCWALLALRDAPEKPGRALSLAWLQTEFAKIESAGSLALARIALESYGIQPPHAKRELCDWTASELAEDGTHVLAWVCLALNPERRWPTLSVQAAAVAAR